VKLTVLVAPETVPAFAPVIFVDVGALVISNVLLLAVAPPLNVTFVVFDESVLNVTVVDAVAVKVVNPDTVVLSKVYTFESNCITAFAAIVKVEPAGAVTEFIFVKVNVDVPTMDPPWTALMVMVVAVALKVKVLVLPLWPLTVMLAVSALVVVTGRATPLAAE
jgi:hypothetical protein